MSPPDALLLFLAAILGGTLNSVAGGGSFIAFPALVFTGMDPIAANATNTVALWPGSLASAGAFRSRLQTEAWRLMLLGGISLAGGYIGARLLLGTGKETFESLLPWLLLGATLLFAFGGSLTSFLRERLPADRAPTWLGTAGVALLQFAIAIYGGYFGGGIGILMLAALSLVGMSDIHRMNALKTVLGSLINGVAVAAFVVAKMVAWPQASLMVVGAALGGYLGAHYSMKMNPGAVRKFVIAVGFAMTGIFFYKYGL